jgi:hypothetical protein
MISAVVMAGYNNKREVKRYSRVVAENYGERFIETGYKPLREFICNQDGEEVSKPLIQYTLERLHENNRIAEVVIVGHRMLLEQRLHIFLKEFDKPCCIVNQNSKISSDVIRRFNIKNRKVKYNSIAGNFIKGYAACRAYREGGHALFVASDSPLTTNEFLDRFLTAIQQHRDHTAILVPAVFIDERKDRLGRLPLRLINDSEYRLAGYQDSCGRQGFRLSSLIIADPHRFDVNTANTAYSLRKCLNPKVQIKLFKITRGLGYPNLYSKYFLRRDLTIVEVENIGSAYFGGRLKIIPMLGEEATYDYDGTDLEFRMISGMLKTETREPIKKMEST